MIVRISSGIRGFDDLFGGMGSLPENTVTLLYGPPKVGKYLFSYAFAAGGADSQEPCLYISADYGIADLKRNMEVLNMNPEALIENELFYVIDAASSISGSAAEEGNTYLPSSVHNPTDIMVKLGVATRNITQRYTMFRSVLDSLTTLMAFNDEMLVVRVLTAYMMRIKDAGGTALVTYTEGSADQKVETMLKAVVDNIIHLDGSRLTVEAMVGTGRLTASYTIDEEGITVQP